MKERSIDMKFILDEPVVSDEEYAKLIKMDWNTRATGDTTLYVCASSHASEEELISTGLRDYKRHFKSGFDFRDMRKPGFTVLEYGCGIGRMSNHIARDVYTLHAVDICEEHIKIAKQRLSSIHNIEFEAVNGLDLHNFRDG
jgi:2-polyprenyl-3-methyl-5-hydroxy-6-metoxy-1,4-benzoquinol methylase